MTTHRESDSTRISASHGGTAEQEQYDLREITLHTDGNGTTRREFLRVLGGGLVVALITRDAFAFPMRGRQSGAQPNSPGEAPEELGAWLHIDEHGAVTVYTGKVEFGQGIRTSLAQEAAEELRVPLASIRMVMGDTDLTPYDMGTFGSRSTPQMGTQLRKVGAAARELLIGLAAERWGVDRSTLTAADGRVTDPRSHRSLGYGDLTAGRRLTETVRDDVTLTPAARWTVAGTSAPKVGARAVVTGRHQYTSDMRVPGMLHGKVLRAPSIGATLASFDAGATRSMPRVTVTRDGDFAGVVAPSLADAQRALTAIHATWTPAAGPQPSSSDIYAYLKRTRPKESGSAGERWRETEPFVKGDVSSALASADHRLQATYTVAYIAHVPLEPRAAVAQWTHDAKGDKLTVWTGTQRPFAVREELANAFGLPVPNVRVIVPDTGSGYGGKHTGEAAVEAARLAKAAGRPVKLVWTREEEFRWAYFRPAGVIDVDAGVRRDGTITAWTFDNYNSGPAAIRPMYAIANQRVSFHPSDSPLRQGSYRALAATANHFARETHIDDLAHAVRMDALELRLKNIDDPRLRAVFEAAADRFGWKNGARTTHDSMAHGIGIAGGFEKGGYIATCAEVAVNRSSGDVRIVRAVSAFDNGAVVNPDGLRNQIAGALIQGIGGALFEAIDFDHGVIRNAHLADYRVPRFADVPDVDVVLIDRKDQPSFGAGEAPIMALAPAVGSAIFQATGVRPRSLPMARGGLSSKST
ncbi:MAG TPA: molybdopterin cofactor-binding domain-containing protein [Gemmatimonadaceae bacterium]|nr:molybdopterin cofactor-binding domain-containing protein [Gemmatimonadaceae bacterium]